MVIELLQIALVLNCCKRCLAFSGCVLSYKLIIRKLGCMSLVIVLGSHILSMDTFWGKFYFILFIVNFHTHLRVFNLRSILPSSFQFSEWRTHINLMGNVANVGFEL